MILIKFKIESYSKLVRLKLKLTFKTEGFNSKLVRLKRASWTTLCQFYHGIMARVKTFFGMYDFWIALQSFGLQC